MIGINNEGSSVLGLPPVNLIEIRTVTQPKTDPSPHALCTPSL